MTDGLIKFSHLLTDQRPEVEGYWRACDLDLQCGNQCFVHGILLMMPHLSHLRRLFLILTPDCDPDLEFGNTYIMCDIPSNYGLPFL